MGCGLDVGSLRALGPVGNKHSTKRKKSVSPRQNVKTCAKGKKIAE